MTRRAIWDPPTTERLIQMCEYLGLTFVDGPISTGEPNALGQGIFLVPPSDVPQHIAPHDMIETTIDTLGQISWGITFGCHCEDPECWITARMRANIRAKYEEAEQ